MDAPKLTEPNTTGYLYYTLKQCHDIRVNWYSYALNLGVLIIFLAVFGGALYYSKANKLTDYEKQNRMVKDQQYILSKIRFYQDINDKQKQNSSSITNLPVINQHSGGF